VVGPPLFGESSVASAPADRDLVAQPKGTTRRVAAAREAFPRIPRRSDPPRSLSSSSSIARALPRSSIRFRRAGSSGFPHLPSTA